MHGISQNLMGKGFETRMGHGWEAGLGTSPTYAFVVWDTFERSLGYIRVAFVTLSTTIFTSNTLARCPHQG